MSLNAYQRLRAHAQLNATRNYSARGILAERCERCQLKTSHCICHYRPSGASQVDMVLIMHRDELFKPTNSGRLIADCFPAQTHAYCWSRLEPDPQLLALLQDPGRQCAIVFPAGDESDRERLTEIAPNGRKRVTLILLDGTWKQARRMFNLSPWLKELPCLAIDPTERARYVTRNAAFDHYLSTAESAALALAAAGDSSAGGLLFDWFNRFNLHYGAMRSNMTPEQWQARNMRNQASDKA